MKSVGAVVCIFKIFHAQPRHVPRVRRVRTPSSSPLFLFLFFLSLTLIIMLLLVLPFCISYFLSWVWFLPFFPSYISSSRNFISLISQASFTPKYIFFILCIYLLSFRLSFLHLSPLFSQSNPRIHKAFSSAQYSILQSHPYLTVLVFL